MLTYITSIRDALIEGNDWAAWLRQLLADEEITLGSDELILHGDDVVGRFALIDRAVAAQTYAGASWLSLAPRPWVGEVAGFFSWTHAGDENIAMSRLVPSLIHDGRGTIARLDNGRHHDAVRLRRFPLATLLGRHGFDDGDALLARDGAYVRYVVDEVTRVLDEAGLSAHVGMFGTAHNPIQISGEVRRDGVALADPEAALASLSVEVWAYDWTILRDTAFWID